MAESIKHRRRIQGTVMTDARHKTVVVRVDRVKVHPKYHIRYTVSKRYKAHDESESYHVGDVVIIEECRPLSKDKRWRVMNKVSR